MSAIQRIVFVWNADFSLAGGMRALKEVATGHHSCTLCAIAYHRIRQTRDWTAYKAELSKRYGLVIKEPCRNQLKQAERAAADGDFPAVLAHTNKGVLKLLGSRDIDACRGDFARFKDKLDRILRNRVG